MKGKPRKKDNSSKKPSTSSIPSLNKEDGAINELTSQAFIAFLREQAHERVKAKKNLDSLNATILEFLNSFILIGYDDEGTPVKMISAHNQQEADSLATLLNKFFVSSNYRQNDNDSAAEDGGE